ncbi:MAG: chorismate mutase [Rhodobiaceae bacterium]|nr:chorismate mutase [Rhodobiaceae bacterium]RPF98496.1 MAG: chorismate mutase [Rhizobiales bacterium TMED162]
MSERAPLPCPEMQDIREQIDALDKRLVALLAERQKLIAAAGKVKPSRDMVRDEARIEEVIALVLAEAETAGLAGGNAAPGWGGVIEKKNPYEKRVGC